MGSDKSVDAGKVYDRLKEYLGLESDSALARYFGETPQVLRNWRARNSLQLDRIVEKVPEVDLDWLILGRGKPGKPPKKASK